jgi:hypothetical protein
MRGRFLQARPAGWWTGAFVLLGLGLRAYHFLRIPSLWHDEAALVLNVISKDFAELLGPLFCFEAAPPLFLWIERAVRLALGDGLLALRLVPFLASCASLLLLVPIARRLLEPRAVPWAILLFACSDRLLWHACEAKPYALDVLGATLVLAVHVWTENGPLLRRLLLYTLLAPLLIFVSYPGCFLCGGILIALLPAILQHREPRLMAAYGLLGLVVALTFLVLLLGPIRAQRCGEMDSCWLTQFPPLHFPWRVPGWVFFSSLDVVNYCYKPVGQFLAVPALVGLFWLWRQKQQPLVLLVMVPWLLGLIASFLKAYPYGGTRVDVFLAPALALLIGAGLPVCLAWLNARSRLATVALGAVVLVPIGRTAYHVAVPWDRADCAGASAYILARHQPGEAILTDHWEYLYYFRHVKPRVVLLPGTTGEPAPRCWIVLSGGEPDHRQRMIAQMLSAGWSLEEQRDFAHAGVFLLLPPKGPDRVVHAGH